MLNWKDLATEAGWHVFSFINSESKFVVALKYIAGIGMMVACSAMAVRGSDDSTSGSGDLQIRTAIAIFQDQKAEFLRQQREIEKTRSGKLRHELREQLAATRAAALGPLRTDVRQSLQDARSHAVEQSRKLLEESTQAVRQSHHAQ